MVTRENRVNDYWLTETRKKSHWMVFDFLGFLMHLTSNSYVNFPFLFAFVYKQYVRFTLYSRPYSNLAIKKISVTDDLGGDYSALIEEAIKKLEENPSTTIN